MFEYEIFKDVVAMVTYYFIEEAYNKKDYILHWGITPLKNLNIIFKNNKIKVHH